MCVAFFWRASEALLTQPTASALSRAASRAINYCAAAQRLLPLDLSVLTRCLRQHADRLGHGSDGSRGIAAFNKSWQWASAPGGHVFRIPGRVRGHGQPVPGSRFVVFWLPARRNV